MMKKLREYIRKITEGRELRIKLILTNICFAVIPVIILGSFSYSAFYINFKNLMYSSLNSLYSQVNGRVNDYYSKIVSISRTVFSADKFQLDLISYNESPDNNAYLALRNQLINMKNLDDSIDAVFVFTENGAHISSEPNYIPQSVIEYLENLRKENQGNGRVVFDTSVDLPELKNKYLAIQTIKGTNYKHLETLGFGVLVLERQYISNILNKSEMLEDSDTIIVNEKYNVISSQRGAQDMCAIDFSSLHDKDTFNHNGKKYITKLESIERLDWKIITMIPVSAITERTKPITISLVLIIAVVFALLCILLGIVSKNITKPIKVLTDAFSRVADGDLKCRIHFESKSELSTVEKGFNSMTHDIHSLTRKMLHTQEKLYEAELEKSRTEMDLLFSQINSHFLFNTLSVIRGLAAENQMKELGVTLKSLVQMLRYVTRKAKYVWLSDEISYLKVYMDIQNVRHNNIFVLQTDISEESSRAVILKLLLQPMVENAIMHGFVKKRTNCIISVQAYVQEGTLKVIVADNGDGIDPDKLRWIREQCNSNPELGNRAQEIKNIGIVNIQQRIKLFYGSRFGMEIESEEDKYSKFIFTLPFITDTDEDMEE